ncbi:ribonuclease H family protein [Clostridium paraputrificum]|uniref:ribonuclease H1 domain-containing protein n=1 Tax=Clostridium paraputrificum TaxID=29363 RepID=UPI001603A226|nr:ribonuclease H family protein [Clostridium paraputrificum]MDC0800769.1 ribonuclease H family protein [Clostridium paraputrificum]
MKYYVVKNGKKTGIYDEWKECEKQVKGFPNAVYKSFRSLEEAKEYYYGKESKQVKIKSNLNLLDDEAIIYVDGSYDNTVRRYGYGAIIFNKGEKRILQGGGSEENLIELRNVAGELKAAINSMKYAINNGIKKVYLHYDYLGIENWFTGEWKANTKLTKEYSKFAKEINSILDVIFIKVKAHSGDKYNEEVDKIAKDAIKKMDNNKSYFKGVDEKKECAHSSITKKGILPIFNLEMDGQIISDTSEIMSEFKSEWKKSKRKLNEIKNISISIDVVNRLTKFYIDTENEKLEKIIKF